MDKNWSHPYEHINSINPLIPKTVGIERPQDTETPLFLFQRYPKFTSPLKNRNDSWHSRNSKKIPYSPNPSGRAILTKKACTAGVKSITLNDIGWKLHSDIRTATVLCLSRRLGRSRIDRVKK
ncbi:hypothetical protein AVEN_218830-1 [Araneus ventricosus]|uniref:Uncharacterized protein n=1 Tax=Araneus ventricosus TaxID=182803 RepID=A0A4Y2CP16_ARAVE|nr:hypothetical protein AVEN_218830-1 [Araneus ventricosus]